ncbi:MAG: fluoride efflux transporter CrcB [Verrucomicrobiota bacterium]|nr:fluoride efflux transporter CrcB [Verrucomicrobiota bacterium]
MTATYLLIGLGSALGGISRAVVTTWMTARFAGNFPTGTLLVNATGALAIGFCAALLEPQGRFSNSEQWRSLLVTGFLGGYTTFSAFSLQTFSLLEEGRYVIAAGYAVGSVLLCLAGVWIGQLAYGRFSAVS